MDLIVLYVILLLASLVLLVLSAFQVKTAKVNLMGFGLALWVAVPLIQTLQKL